MPHEIMTVPQVARYLHLPAAEVEKLAARGQVPARKVRGGFQFVKSELDHWVEERMHELPDARLAEIERGVVRHHGMEDQAELVCPLIPQRGGVLVPLAARTRDSAVRTLVQAADAAGLVCDPNDLVEKVLQREDMCPTIMAPGLALPHPRHPLPHDIAESFIIVGRTDGGIPFGSPDGSLTRLFFLICCKDDRTHLHVLARLARILTDDALSALLEAADADAVRALLARREQAVLAE